LSQFGISNRKVLFIIWRCLHIQGHKVFLKCKVQFWFLNGNKSLMKHKKALMHTSPDVQINILTYWTKLWRQLDRHAVVVVVVATASSNDDCSLFCGFELLVFYNRTKQNKKSCFSRLGRWFARTSTYRVMFNKNLQQRVNSINK